MLVPVLFAIAALLLVIGVVGALSAGDPTFLILFIPAYGQRGGTRDVRNGGNVRRARRARQGAVDELPLDIDPHAGIHDVEGGG